MHPNTGDQAIERTTEMLWRSHYLDAVELVTKNLRPYVPQWEESECWIGPNDFAVSTWRVEGLAFTKDDAECTFTQKRPKLGPLERHVTVVQRINP